MYDLVQWDGGNALGFKMPAGLGWQGRGAAPHAAAGAGRLLAARRSSGAAPIQSNVDVTRFVRS